MKKIILLVGLFMLYQITYGQCDKKITFKFNKLRVIKDGLAGQESPVEGTLSIDSGALILAVKVNEVFGVITGAIKEIVICDWSEFLKNGKAAYKALTKKEGQDTQNSFIVIESENGYTRITFGSDPDEGSRLQFDVAEYELMGDGNTTNKPAKQEIKKKEKKKKA